ncbi:MAG: ABC transporter [Thermodesulfobacteriota bacterium]
MIRFLKLFTLAAGLLAVLSSCSGIRNEYQEKMMFRLEASPQMAAFQDQKTGQGLLVKRFSISPEFESSLFMYRVNKNRFGSDFYNNYVVPPAQMITDLIMENLYASPLFSPVSPNSMDDIQYQLWGKIIELYGDIRDKKHLKAVVTIRMRLDKNEDGTFKPVNHKTYTANFTLSEPSPEAYIDGLNQGLTKIMNDFFEDLKVAGMNSK